MKKVLLFAVIILVFGNSMATFAQKKPPTDTLKPLFSSTDQHKKYIPTFSPLSPNTSGIEKFGEHQVSLSTGIPDIKIVLGNARSGSLNNPVILRYHASGFKIDDLASWVGWGWNLDFGPSLNRSVKGQADDKDGTFGNNYLNVPIAQRNFCDVYDDYIFGKNVLAGQADIQPDLFSFNIFKNTGKFYLGQTDSPHFIVPFQPIQIKKHLNTNGFLSNFDLINQEGQQFVFGKQKDGNFAHETFTLTSGASTQSHINNWLITQIQAPNSNDEVSFEYQNGGSQSLSSLSYSASIYYNRSPTCSPYQPDQNEPAYCPQFYPLQGTVTPTETRTESTIGQTNIYKITHENGYIEFEQSTASERLDLSNSRFLKKIKFYNYENGSPQLLRTITFNYDYFQGVGGEKRLKLQSLTFNDANQLAVQTYQFDYFTNTFSWNTSDYYRPRQDFFGYYNGSSNTHLVSVGSYATGDPNIGTVNINGGAADRTTVNTYAKECVLKKITFPTFGYTEFDYVNNQYDFNNTTKLAGGLRVTSIKNIPNSTAPALLKRYTYGIVGTDNIGRFTTNWFPENAQVPKIHLLQHLSTSVGGGSSATQAIFTQNGFLDVGSFDQASLYYTHVKEFFEDENDVVKNGYNDYTFDFRNDLYIETPNYASRDVKPWLRGNLLTKKTFNSANVLVESNTNEYASNDPKANSLPIGAYIVTPNIIEGEGSGNGSLIACIDNPEFFSNFHVMEYGLLEYQTGSHTLEKTTVWRDSVTTQQNYYYDDNLFVKKIEDLDSYTNQKHIQETVYPTDASYNSDLIAVRMRNRNMLDLPLESIEKEDLNGNIDTLFRQKTIYQALTTVINARGLDSSFVPKSILVAPTGNVLEKRVDFAKYDTTGNVLEYKVDSLPTALLWGYNKSLLLAQIQNATSVQVQAKLTSAGITESAFSVTNLSNTELTSIETFRNSLPKATLVSWFSHRPNVGLSMSIAPNGLKNSFVYDAFQRLLFTKDHENYITGKYVYQFGLSNNKITSFTPREGNTNENTIFYSVNSIINHQYFDGLGRYLQTIGESQSPDSKGVVSGDTKYDKYGSVSSRIISSPTLAYLDAFEPNALSKAKVFYGDNAPLDSIVYEKSPLNRVIAIFGVGNVWRISNKKIQIFYESAGVDVRYYLVDANGNISKNGTYPTQSLFKKRVIDEQGNTSIEITDKRGRLVQKQIEYKKDSLLTTYYIYDGLGRELAIIQPEGFATDASISSGSTAWNNFVFFYKYDVRGLQIESHIPNGGRNYSVYDKQDRQVLSQDEYQRTDNKWSFMKYDSLSRNIISGELILTNADTRASLQTQFDAQTIRNEHFDANSPAKWYYSDVSFPFSVDSSKAISVNYYDNYDTWRPSGFDFSPLIGQTQYTDVKGLQTGVARRNTENKAMLFDVNYYDNRNRNIQIRRKNIADGISYFNYRYNFTNDLTLDYQVYNPFQIKPEKSYSYDNNRRKTGFSHRFIVTSNQPPPLIAQYIYDDVSRLKTKKIKPNSSYEINDTGANYINRPPIFEQANTQDIANKAVTLSPGFVADAADNSTQTYLAQIDTLGNSGTIDALQTIDYEYNIRGGVNCINCKNKTVRLGNKQNDLFSMKLDYNEDQRFFDGNISKQTWKNPLIPNIQQFKYSYDASSRLKKAQYLGGNNGSNYSLDTLNYDRNGNIKQLKRHAIDDLSYIYDGNKLLSVTDAGNTSGFNDGNTSGNDYEYWNDGSLKRDKNKGIDSIFYNSYLRKVSRVKFSNGNWINFYYDGAGTLLKRKLSNNDVWTYTDDLITKNGQFYQLNHDEGRLTYDYVNSKWVYEFDYRDVWGNLRLSFRDSTVANKPPFITQTADLDMLGYELSTSQKGSNHFLFQKQERINDFDLDIDLFKFRPSDSKIGRFWQIDPLASKYPHNSPYALQENKFGLGVELEGLEVGAFFGTTFFENTTIIRPMVMPRTGGVLETVTRTTPLRINESSLIPLTQGHHLSPNAVKDHKVVQEARQEGFKQDGKENKMDVEKFDKKSGDGRHGNHPEYNKEVKSRYDKFETDNPSRTPNESLDFVRKTVSDLKNDIIKSPDVKINDLFKANTVAPSDNTRVQPPVNKTNVYPCPGGPNCT